MITFFMKKYLHLIKRKFTAAFLYLNNNNICTLGDSSNNTSIYQLTVIIIYVYLVIIIGN